MQNNKYLDPDNVIEIKECITNAENLGKIKEIVDEIFPGWIVGTIKEYSEDYPELEKHWMNICFEKRVSQKEIMIVDFISFEDTYSLIKIFCEILTLSGFCVRTQNELFQCKICKKAIPQEHIYNLMKKNGSNVPDVWRVMCKKCM